MSECTEHTANIRLGLVSDGDTLRDTILGLHGCALEKTLTWSESYRELSAEEELTAAGRLWLLDLRYPQRAEFGYYLHALQLLRDTGPYMLIDSAAPGRRRSADSTRWWTFLAGDARFTVTELANVPHILSHVVAQSPKEIIHATTLTSGGMETRFIDGAVRLLELRRVKALLGRSEGEIRGVTIGADRSFIVIEFMDGTREFLPADIIRADCIEDAATVTAAVGYSAALTGERIRRARLRAALTQAQLAAHIGMSRHAILRFESGRTLPKISDLEHIASAVGMELGELLRVEVEGEQGTTMLCSDANSLREMDQ